MNPIEQVNANQPELTVQQGVEHEPLTPPLYAMIQKQAEKALQALARQWYSPSSGLSSEDWPAIAGITLAGISLLLASAQEMGGNEALPELVPSSAPVVVYRPIDFTPPPLEPEFMVEEPFTTVNTVLYAGTTTTALALVGIVGHIAWRHFASLARGFVPMAPF